MNLDVHLKYTISNPSGRQHWPKCFSAILASCGIRGDTLYGESDKVAAYPESDPVHPQDIKVTVLHALGVPLHDPADNTGINRPNFTIKAIFG